MRNGSLSDIHKLFLSDFFSIGSHVCSVLASRQGLSYLGDKRTHWLKEGAWKTRTVGEKSKIRFNPVFIFISQKVLQNDWHSQKKKASTIKSQAPNPLCLGLEREPKEIVF